MFAIYLHTFCCFLLFSTHFLQDYTTSGGAIPCLQLFFIIKLIASLKLSLVELSIVILC